MLSLSINNKDASLCDYFFSHLKVYFDKLVKTRTIPSPLEKKDYFWANIFINDKVDSDARVAF